jgi:hypothetical protein
MYVSEPHCLHCNGTCDVAAVLDRTLEMQRVNVCLALSCCRLEVGRIMVDGQMNVGWNRAHFGA